MVCVCDSPVFLMRWLFKYREEISLIFTEMQKAWTTERDHIM